MNDCEWFLMCVNEAAGKVWHPVIGWVPTCRDCANRLSLDIEPLD